jgi:hypothetical protein
VLRTRSPLIPGPKPRSPFDLHVLSAPPAFVLSQDQTLRRDFQPPHDARGLRGSALFYRSRPAPRGTLGPTCPTIRRSGWCGIACQGRDVANHASILTRHWHSHAVQFSRCERHTEPTATNGAPSEEGYEQHVRISLGLWCESEAFLRRQVATVFENSTACVKCRDLTTSVVGLKLTRRSFGIDL